MRNSKRKTKTTIRPKTFTVTSITGDLVIRDWTLTGARYPATLYTRGGDVQLTPGRIRKIRDYLTQLLGEA